MADSTQTIGSAVETSLLFRLSSLSMLRTIDRFRQSCFDRAATSTSRPAAPFTPARARGSFTPLVRRDLHNRPVQTRSLCRFMSITDSAVPHGITHEAENFNARSISPHPCGRIDRNSLGGQGSFPLADTRISIAVLVQQYANASPVDVRKHIS